MLLAITGVKTDIMNAKFNPYEVKISHHAKTRYLERNDLKVKSAITKSDYLNVEGRIRNELFAMCFQNPLSKGSHNRKHFRNEDNVFVLSDKCDIVVTFYKYQKLSKSKVKQIRKSIS